MKFGEVIRDENGEVELVGPGLHWYPPIIYSHREVDVRRIYDFKLGSPVKEKMITSDENLVDVELAVQYRINDPYKFLYKVTDPINSMTQATLSALRQIVGRSNFDYITAKGRGQVRNDVQEKLKETLKLYNTGIEVTQVNLMPVQPPKNVEQAVLDKSKAIEDREKSENEGRAYAAKVTPIAEGKSNKMIREAEAYKLSIVNYSKAKTAKFLAILPEYNKSPKVMRERIYLDAMSEVLSRTSKIYMPNNNGNSMMYLPLDKIISSSTATNSSNSQLNLKVESLSPTVNSTKLDNMAKRSVSHVGSDSGSYGGDLSKNPYLKLSSYDQDSILSSKFIRN